MPDWQGHGVVADRLHANASLLKNIHNLVLVGLFASHSIFAPSLTSATVKEPFTSFESAALLTLNPKGWPRHSQPFDNNPARLKTGHFEIEERRPWLLMCVGWQV